MKALKIAKGTALAVIFVLLVHLCARYCGLVLFPRVRPQDADRKNWSQDYSTYYFGMTRRNTVDEVFVGSSHQFCSIDVNILNKEYGMNSILLASSDQNLTLSYYAVKEALELQDPSVIILEVGGATAPEKNISELSKECFLDNMPNWTHTKRECAKELEDPIYYHYYPVTVLHSAWQDFRFSDLLLPPRLAKGERYCYKYPFSQPQDISLISPDEKTPLSDYACGELSRIAELCRDENVKLVLYAAPYAAGAEDQRRLNAVADFAEEYGISYYNMIYEAAAAGIDPETDYLDEGHLNQSGQEKLTRYMAQNGCFMRG